MDSPIIPERYVEFGREVGRLAKRYGLREFDIRIHPGYEEADEWRDMIVVTWKQGRHGEAADHLHLSSMVQRLVSIMDSAKPPAREDKQ